MIVSILSFVFWVIMVCVVFVQARDQGRNVVLWVISTFIVTPVLPAIVLFVLGKMKK